MSEYSLGEALNEFLKNARWKARFDQVRLQKEWETIMGKTIARYTNDVELKGKTLVIYTDVGPLKQELRHSSEMIIKKINEAFGETLVSEVVIK